MCYGEMMNGMSLATCMMKKKKTKKKKKRLGSNSLRFSGDNDG
jgi:hypothetical protein